MATLLFSKACKLFSCVSLGQLRKCYRDAPVVLLPTHRSYMDFLLLSYMMFEYNLPLPYIAAGAGTVTDNSDEADTLVGGLKGKTGWEL